MLRRALRRLGAGIALIWLVATFTFLLVSAAPGDFATRLTDPRIPPAARERWRRDFGLDRPLPARYASWLAAAATGDLGSSWIYKQKVSSVLASVLPNTLLLTSLGLALELALGVALAIVQLRRPHGTGDRLITLATLTAYALPTFGVALGLVAVLSYRLHLLPPSHMLSLEGELAHGWARLPDLARHLVLPVVAIGVAGVGAVARYLRGSLLDERLEQYVLAARARGCSPRQALVRHALPNALLPLITMMGMSLPFLVSGSLVIEVVFSWPGMGQVMYNAALGRDLPLLLGGTIVATAAVVVGNLLADLAYAVADPRVRV
ncbi:MAG TPA: ABC transporter permease [Thermoanaerobaculaceae bacterium]|nr:ABC transporter permease [Thermoanaerobaculaceae bacterium]